MKDVHAEKTGAIAQEVQQLRKALPDKDKMKLGFDEMKLHKGKILIDAKGINYGYNDKVLWPQPLSFQIISGSRTAIKGANGAGKTTLIKLMLDELQPTTGAIYRAATTTVYIDQDYSLIDNKLSVYRQAQQFNSGPIPEAEVKSRLAHFLFTAPYWDKPCASLSGGEKMRLMLCCLTISNLSPDMILLDEPTNNLDIQNIEILTAAISDYKGTLIVISHDAYFLEQVRVDEEMVLNSGPSKSRFGT